jgi:hypothetical protein
VRTLEETRRVMGLYEADAGQGRGLESDGVVRRDWETQILWRYGLQLIEYSFY